MTEAKLKRIYAETAANMYYNGALDVCDILTKALAGMPDQEAKITVQEFMVAVAVAKNAVLAKSQDKSEDPQNGAHG